MAAFSAENRAKIVGEQVQQVADILRRKTCVLGEEPLQGACDRLRVSLRDLEQLLVQRAEGASKSGRCYYVAPSGWRGVMSAGHESHPHDCSS